ncbi:hypothetical protein [Collinsella intestinalis]|uniref:hypothetical protein n=1 Tax=Collinsella intestinalis TaxID=147207 RepID=UPI0025A4992B|nr:hypothetical protein [Collinsella intestinalis]MDM8164129.1 hypothetical protein [Collinsella intestinalis]
MAEKKSKITIGPDGTIHVDDEEKSAESAGPEIDPDGTIHINHRNAQSSPQKKTHGAASRKTVSQPTSNRYTTASGHGTEFRNSKPASDQRSPQHKEPLPRLLVGTLIALGWGLMLIGAFTNLWALSLIGAAIATGITLIDDEYDKR